MKTNYPAIIILSLLIFFLLLELRRTALNSAETFNKCICSSSEGGRECVCQDTNMTERAYDEGIATEFTDRAPKGWTKISPGDVNFPVRPGCCPHNKNGWTTDDFTDFGSNC